MKRILALLLVLVLCFSICSCNSSDTGAKDGQQETENAGVETDALQEDYDEIINSLKNKEYDIAINMIKQLQKDAIKAENDAKGIKEVAITIDNWDEYFEFGYNYYYYHNSFGEITHINCASGFKLKDGYEIVKDNNDCKSSVAFEAELEQYEGEVTYDFKAGTYSVVDIDDNKEDNNKKTSTTTFSDSIYMEYSKDYPVTGVAGIGYGWQGAVDDGDVQKESVTRIIEVLRAEGTIYLYEN